MWDPKKLLEKKAQVVLVEAPRSIQDRPRVSFPARDLRPSYAARRAALTALGFASYRNYCASDLWASIKARVRARSGGDCERGCGKRARLVHHYSYDIETLRGDDIDLVAHVCGSCHISVHAGPRRDKKTVRIWHGN